MGIIALLLGLLLPTLTKAREQAIAVKCMSNLHVIGQSLVNYTVDNKGYICPSYNMPSVAPGAADYTAIGPTQAMDGWPCILERDGYARSSLQDQSASATVFYCPGTYDIYGMQNGQTGSDAGKARGYIDWPMMFDGSHGGGDSDNQSPVTIPSAGFNKIIRCSYWINSFNPVGPVSAAPASLASGDLYYTVCAGYGPDVSGLYTRPHKMSAVRASAQLVVAADGVYMGKQNTTRLLLPNWIPQSNSRIGYRHPGVSGDNTVCNVAFADGHVSAISGQVFPQARTIFTPAASSNAVSLAPSINGPTVYLNPAMSIGQ